MKIFAWGRLAAAVVLLSGSTLVLVAQPPAARSAAAECAADRDCVPAQCCHADACVPLSRAPQCDGVVCTQECQQNTLDCGGRCTCEAGQCVAHLRTIRLPGGRGMQPRSP